MEIDNTGDESEEEEGENSIPMFFKRDIERQRMSDNKDINVKIDFVIDFDDLHAWEGFIAQQGVRDYNVDVNISTYIHKRVGGETDVLYEMVKAFKGVTRSISTLKLNYQFLRNEDVNKYIKLCNDEFSSTRLEIYNTGNNGKMPDAGLFKRMVIYVKYNPVKMVEFYLDYPGLSPDTIEEKDIIEFVKNTKCRNLPFKLTNENIRYRKVGLYLFANATKNAESNPVLKIDSRYWQVVSTNELKTDLKLVGAEKVKFRGCILLCEAWSKDSIRIFLFFVLTYILECQVLEFKTRDMDNAVAEALINFVEKAEVGQLDIKTPIINYDILEVIFNNLDGNVYLTDLEINAPEVKWDNRLNLMKRVISNSYLRNLGIKFVEDENAIKAVEEIRYLLKVPYFNRQVHPPMNTMEE